jgi:hypothetical protein
MLRTYSATCLIGIVNVNVAAVVAGGYAENLKGRIDKVEERATPHDKTHEALADSIRRSLTEFFDKRFADLERRVNDLVGRDRPAKDPPKR